MAAAVLRRGRDDIPHLTSLDHFVRLVVAALLGAVTIATLASIGIAAFDTGDVVLSWRSVFCSHAASVIVIVPVAMTWQRPVRQHGWELPVQLLALTAMTLAVFSPDQSLSLDLRPAALPGLGSPQVRRPHHLLGAGRLRLRRDPAQCSRLRPLRLRLRTRRPGRRRGGHPRPGLPAGLRADDAAPGHHHRPATAAPRPGDQQRAAVPPQLHRVHRRHGAAARCGPRPALRDHRSQRRGRAAPRWRRCPDRARPGRRPGHRGAVRPDRVADPRGGDRRLEGADRGPRRAGARG